MLLQGAVRVTGSENKKKAIINHLLVEPNVYSSNCFRVTD